MYTRIQEKNHQEGSSRQGNSHQQAQQQNAVAARRNRGIAAVGTVNHARIVVGHGLRQRIFLPAVQQEEVKSLLDFLLTLDRQHLAFLGRDRRYPHLRLLFPALCVPQFHIDAHNHVVHRPDDVLLQGPERVVQFFHHRVPLTAVRNQLVTLQFGHIILVNLRLDVHVADTRIGRNQVGFLFRVGQVILDVTGQTELGFKFQCIGVVLLRFAHIHTSRRRDVHHLVVTLECFQVRFHIAQFLSDDDQTFVDKLGRIYSHLVLVLDGFFVIHRNQHVQHILCTGRRRILHRERQNGRLVLFLTDTDISLIISHHRINRQFPHMHLLSLPLVAVEVGSRHHDSSRRKEKSVVQRHRITFLVFFRSKIRNYYLLFILRNHRKGHSLFLGGIHKTDAHRGQAVKLIHPEPVFHLVTHIGMRPLNHFPQQFLRTELKDFICHVHLINIIVVSVQSRRTRFVGRVFDNHRSRTEIHERCPGILQPRHSHAYHDGNQKPFPFGDQIHGQIHHVQALAVLIRCLHFFLV